MGSSQDWKTICCGGPARIRRDVQDLNHPGTYAELAVKLGIKLKLHSPAPRTITPDLAAEFAESRALGVTSYPALLLQGHGRLTAADLSHDPELAGSRIKELLN